MCLGNDKAASRMTLAAGEKGQELAMTDVGGKNRAKLALTPYGPVLMLADEGGKVIFKAPGVR